MLLSAAAVFGLLGAVDLITGIVTDPQDRVVAGAEVLLHCDGRAETLQTDDEGRFALSIKDEAGRCAITIQHPGFEALTRIVSRADRSLKLQLRLAPTETSTEVLIPNDRIPEMRSSLTSSSLDVSELRRISNNTADLIRFAKARAGTTFGSDSIYVDGFPAGTLPPAEAIARISVNTDPFSAEYSDADQNHVEITTKTPDRHFGFNLGGGALGFGGRNPLVPDGRAQSRSVNFALNAPLPRAFAFSLAGDLSENRRHELTAPARSSIQSVFFTAHFAPSDASHAAVSISDFTSKDSNVGVTGFTSPEAGVQARMATREYRLIWDHASEKLWYRSGFQYEELSSDSFANSSRAGLHVIGGFIEGGNPLLESRMRRGNWTWKNTVRSESARPWAGGFEVSHFNTTDIRIPNPAGVFQFAREAVNRLMPHDYGMVKRATTVAAPFLQVDMIHSERFVLRGGLRGPSFSPRMSMTAQRGQVLFRAGSGIFAENLSNDILLRALHNGFSVNGASVVSQLDGELKRSRKIVTKGSMEYVAGVASYGIEYSWIAGSRLLGSYRRPNDKGFVDILSSDRSSNRHQIHTALQYQKRNQTFVAHYEWVHARDNTDGPFSFPAIQDDVAGEWARSSGVAGHNVDLTGNFYLPGAVSLSVVGTWRSAIPNNITTSEDPFGTFLYVDRGGRARNSGAGPRYGTVSLFAHRDIRNIGIGLQVENVLNTANYLSVVSVIESPLFGRPTGALPGRAVRFWFTFGL